MKNKHLSRLICIISALILTLIQTFCVFAGDSDLSTQKFSDLNLEVKIPSELVCFNRSVTSNNSNLALLNVENVEELQASMKVNNVYLEAVPQDVSYELLINGKSAGNQKDYKELSSDEVNDLFKKYIDASDNISNNSVKENITSSSIEYINDIPYFVTNVKSVSGNDTVIYVKKYYTVNMGNSVAFFIQSNGKEVTDEMSNTLQNVVKSAEYKTIHKSIFENSIVSEAVATIITLIIPIGVLALILFLMTRSSKKKKKQL